MKNAELFTFFFYATLKQEPSVKKISVIAYFFAQLLCRRRHKVAIIAEQNWKFCSRFLRRKAPAEWRFL